MRIEELYSAEELTQLAKSRFQEERKTDHLEGWFLARETAMECDEKFKDDPDSIRIGKTLVEVVKRIPLSLGDYHVFAGTQDDAFARSYALINPAFQVSSFTGYCDPTAVFGDIDPIGDITEERIAGVKKYFNPSLLVNGILITRYNQNTKISKANREIISQLADRLGCSLYDTNIRTSIVVEEAQYEQVVISKYNRNCTVSQDYHNFVIEFLDKEKK